MLKKNAYQSVVKEERLKTECASIGQSKKIHLRCFAMYHFWSNYQSQKKKVFSFELKKKKVQTAKFSCFDLF